MNDEKFNEYTQKLFNTVLDLRKEIDNLRIGYNIIHKRIEQLTVSAETTRAEALRVTIEIEELAKLSLASCDKVYQESKDLNNPKMMEASHDSLLSSQKLVRFVHESSIAFAKKEAITEIK